MRDPRSRLHHLLQQNATTIVARWDTGQSKRPGRLQPDACVQCDGQRADILLRCHGRIQRRHVNVA